MQPGPREVAQNGWMNQLRFDTCPLRDDELPATVANSSGSTCYKSYGSD